MRNLQFVSGHASDLMIRQVDDTVGKPCKRGRVAGNKVFVVTNSDHQRAAQPRGKNGLRPLSEHDCQAIRASQLLDRLFDRVYACLMIKQLAVWIALLAGS